MINNVTIVHVRTNKIFIYVKRISWKKQKKAVEYANNFVSFTNIFITDLQKKARRYIGAQAHIHATWPTRRQIANFDTKI